MRSEKMKALRLTAVYTFIVTLLLVLIMAPGCSGTSNTFTELLNLVPAEVAGTSTIETPFFFTLVDYTSYFTENGISNFTTIEELLNQLDNKPHDVLHNMPGTGDSFITGYGSYAQYTTITDKYVGYNVGDVDAEIQFGYPPREGVAAIGRFDPEATNNALNDQSEWPDWAVDAYTVESYNGVSIYSWGSGFETHMQTRLMPPHIDMLGRARPLAVTDKYLFYHPEKETVKRMIDASQNQANSLADLPEYASIANRLADLNVDRAILAEGSVANLCVTSLEEYPISELVKTNLIEKMGTPLKKFLTFGSGYGKDEKGAFTAIVIYHENSSIARENVSLLKQHMENSSSVTIGKTWNTLFPDAEITSDGKILLLKIYGTNSMLWASWIYEQDSLLYHEE